jgi:ABC-type glycerol-3-phosphate transport system permease component
MAETASVAPAPRARSTSVGAWLARKNRGWYIVAYVLLVVLAIWTLFPFYWQVVTSLRSDASTYSKEISLVPDNITFDNYIAVLTGPQSQFGVQIRNSFVLATVVTLISVFIAALGAYALTRLRFLGRAGLARLLVYCYLVPGTVLFIPLFVMMTNVGLRDNLFGLGMTYLTFTVPFATWMLIGYFKSLPIELEEAAMMDGASRLTILWRIVMPLSAPAVVVVAVFSFTLSWNEFLLALVLLTSKDKLTAPIGLSSYIVADVFYWGQMMAAATLMSLPPLLLYLIGQRWVIAGWTAGAVKS